MTGALAMRGLIPFRGEWFLVQPASRRSLFGAVAGLVAPAGSETTIARRQKRCKKAGRSCATANPGRCCTKRCGCVGADGACRAKTCAAVLQPCAADVDCCDGPCGCFEQTCVCRLAACHLGACATNEECCQGACLDLGFDTVCADTPPPPP
ncbi:MAG TPA: hypothetical protein VFQ80_01655 [Thermomicrobiales bacterium]|jgi:hypothetical protein|nr:hypothetical protein [Thermomicrobiales bacterium]